MKFIFLFLLSFCSITLHGQTHVEAFKDWDEILIRDSYWGWDSFNHEFRIDRQYNLTSRTNPDSIISKIDLGLIDSIFNALITPEHISKDPLLMFNRDSTWLKNNAATLWESFIGGENYPDTINELAIHTIQDYDKSSQVITTLVQRNGHQWTDDYPFTELLIIRDNDTLKIRSMNQYPYMLPWYVNNDEVLNARLPILISKILPENIQTNRFRLAGDGFNEYMIKAVYNRFLKQQIKNIEARMKYPQIQKIERKYNVLNAEISYMASIDWGGWFGKPCLEISVKAKDSPKNVELYAVLGTRFYLKGVRKLINRGPNIIASLKNNPIVLYTSKTEGALGEIHYVNRQSFSRKGKKEFLNDCKESGQSVKRASLKNAIFYELSDPGKSFSRWIFLEDGRYYLWQIKGDKLLNLPDSITVDQGYVCKEIPSELF